MDKNGQENLQDTFDGIIPLQPANTLIVNGLVTIREVPETGLRVVFIGAIPVYYLQREEEHLTRFVCVQLRIRGLAKQEEIATAFGHNRTTQYRWEKRFDKDGFEGLAPYCPKGREPIADVIEKSILKLYDQGMGMRRIAGALGQTIGVVRGVYDRNGLNPQPLQKTLFLADREEAAAEELLACDEQVYDAAAEEPKVRNEQVDDAIEEQPNDTLCEKEFPDVETLVSWDGMLPEYSTQNDVRFGGVLLILPLLARFRILEIFKKVYKYLSLLPVYGLETLITLLVFMALLRIKRPEQIKDHSPVALGKPLGMPRAPEVKTVRRKLHILARRKEAHEVMIKLGDVWLKQEEDLLGFLYLDGHVREYHGKYDLAKGYSMRSRRPERATTDVWANDCRGDPVFRVTSEINEHLTEMIWPALREARALCGDDRPITVIFDRGGWSPQLFVKLIEAGFTFITYRKGAKSDLPVATFEERTLMTEGRKVTYKLHDERSVQIGSDKLVWADGQKKPLFLRQVTKLTDTGHQTQVITPRQDLPAAEVLWRMFFRWRQENFFKYMLQEMDLNALADYGALGVDPELDRRNPEFVALEKDIKSLRSKIEKLRSARCELIGDPGATREAPPGFERFVPNDIKEKELREEITDLSIRLQELEAERDELPERISAGDLQRLKTEMKLLTDLIKTVAYRIETELVRMVAPCYSRVEDEGRKLIAAALSSPADFEVTDRELRVNIEPLSSPHRSRAIASLCDELNKIGGMVPGTNNLSIVLSCRQNYPTDVASTE
jgi:hypothetical protein